MMKRLVVLAILAASLIFIGACDDGRCTQCGFAPGEHVLVYYTDSEGAIIPVSGYANSSGCFTPFECQ